MSWTNAVAGKKALIDALDASAAPALTRPDGTRVKFAYSYVGNEHERELVHAGKVEGQQSYPVFGGGQARFKRDENLTIKLHIVVTIPGGSQYEAELRATEIGGVVEELVAKATLAGLNGQVIKVGITGVDLDSDADDDQAIAVLTYDVGVDSRLS